MNMSVIGWISYDQADTEGAEDYAGGCGGFFECGMRWQDYIEVFNPQYTQYQEALRIEVLRKQLRITGKEHQQDPSGVPVFADGTVGLFSYRAWGDLMAAVWSEAEDTDYNYMSFYM